MSNSLLEEAPPDESPVALGSGKRKWKRIIMFLVAGCLAIYVTFAPGVMPLYSTVLFNPFSYPRGHYDQVSINAITRQQVYFAGPHGTRLNGWFFHVPGATKTILFHHGQGGNLTHCLGWARKFIADGASFFIYDYEGYGLSNGVPTRSGIIEDGEAAFKYLTESRHVPAANIVDCGFSLGTGVASALAADHDFAGVILIAPYTTLKQAALDLMPMLAVYPPPFWPETKLGSWDYVAGKHPPLLIIHGDRDAKINVLHSDLLFKHATATKTFVRVSNYGHGDLHKAEMQSQIREYLQSLEK
ncbi:MAG TPA: alpha/beta hydrolase [Drouetiella sp.]